jgi:aminopeptidase N
MNKLSILLTTGFCLLLNTAIFAQNKPYRDASNPYYWKNRKPYDGYWQQDVAYTIKASLDDKTDIVDGWEELTYYNNSPDTLSFLYFHLYQNAFIKGGYLEQLNLANNFKQKFGKYEAAGKGTEIESITVTNGGYKVTPNIDYSIMRVDLQQPVLPNQSVTLEIKFKTYFDEGGNQRRRMKTFKDKWGNKQYDGVHWYPRICVYDRKFGWETDQHLGKEFYGDFGSYDVEFTFPNNYIMDATGELQNRDEVLPADLRAKLDVSNFKDKPWEEKPSEIIVPNGTTKTWKFKSINTHDFAWVADPTFRIGEAGVTLKNGDKVSCVSLSQEPHSGKWQDAALFTAKVISVYSNDIGNYAYPKMIVADARDGMEYPMLTLDNGMSPSYYGLLAHEVGHNWFFGMVGNNETYRASLDEGFTQFLTNWSMTSILGEVKPTKKNPNPTSRLDGTAYWGYIRDAMKEQDAPLNTHSDDFGGALGHGGGYGHVYYKTATMLYNLQYVLGDSLFLGAMQYYFNQWKMAHPYFEDFRNSITAYTHVDLTWFFDQWMETTKRIDYSIWVPQKVKQADTMVFHARNLNGPDDEYMKRITQTPNQDYYKIRFNRVGEMQMPIDFSVIMKDSQVYKYIIPNTYFVKSHDSNTQVLQVWRGWGALNPTYTATIAVPKNSSIKNVMIDPTYRLADINQLDNSTNFPVYFSMDNLKTDAADRKHYTLNWRPELWYNSIDGVKAGVHLNGHYLNDRLVMSTTVWYNTTLGNDYSGDAKNPMNYVFKLKDRVAKNLYTKFEVRNLDGLSLLNTGIEYDMHNWTVEAYFKWFIRNGTPNVDYLLYPGSWNANQSNSSINIDLSRNYEYFKGNGTYKFGLRASAFSDYDYSRVYFQWLNYHNISRFELHTRTYMQLMSGTNIAPESQLNLAGANSEEMMENKFIRSRAFVPTSWLGYGDNVNHFHAGGGLNVRGYAGYLVPVNTNGTQVYLFTGNNGAAFNAELDFDKFIPLSPRKLSKYFHFDTYLFGDVGALQSTFQAGEYGLTKEVKAGTMVMASAGAGIAFTIKRWLNYDEVKPFTLRFDMPLFLNSTPYVDANYVKFRWVIGVNRAF